MLPTVEELLFRLILVWRLMTLTLCWLAARTVLHSAAIFALFHLRVALKTLSPLRLLDAVIIGVLNSIASLAHVRLWGVARSQEGVLVACLCLVVIRAGYNRATVIPGLTGWHELAGACWPLARGSFERPA